MLVPEAFVAMCKGRFLAVPLVQKQTKGWAP